MQIRFTLRCIQYMMTSALQSEQFTFGQKFVSDTEVQSVVLQWHGQHPALFCALGIQKFADR